MVGEGVLELNSELLHNDTKASKSTLDVLGFLVLEGKDRFLDGTEGLLRNLLQLGLISL